MTRHRLPRPARPLLSWVLGVLVTLGLVFTLTPALAEQLKVIRTGRVYSNHASTSHWVATVHKNDIVTRESSGETSGYIRIRTNLNEVGWVYAQYVTEMGSGGAPSGPAPSGSAPAGPTNESTVAAVVCEEEITTNDDCHDNYPVGCNDSGSYDAYLNLLKNKLLPPTVAATETLTKSDFVQKEQALPSTLKINNHGSVASELAALGEGNIVTAVGTLYYAIHTGKESCNCQLESSEDVVDYHIGFAFEDFPLNNAALTTLRSGSVRSSSDLSSNFSKQDVKKLQQPSFVAEMTPYFREKHPELGFTLDSLAKAIGHKVRITGQLIVDNAHKKTSDDCGLPSATSGCWRASLWEIHPVTRFEVCTASSCTANSNNWVALKDF